VALKELDQERKEHSRFYQTSLERLKSKDFLEYKTSPKIIQEVREFKARIQESDDKLSKLRILMDKLNNELIKQDIVNATNLLTRKAEKMRERLAAAKEKLGQIQGCGETMDGNTSHIDEEEFIEALKDEMPSVFTKIEGNLRQIDKIENLIQKVRETKDI
jgi:hypothetical protein